jgi:hypothetical protein
MMSPVNYITRRQTAWPLAKNELEYNLEESILGLFDLPPIHLF